jgi:hypothetical protein
MKAIVHVKLPNGDSFDTHLNGDRIELGRSADCALSLGDDKSNIVSWKHLVIEEDNETNCIELSDLNSTNGTFLNDTRVTDKLEIKIGDKIRLGETGPVITILSIVSDKNMQLSPVPSAGEKAVKHDPRVDKVSKVHRIFYLDTGMLIFLLGVMVLSFWKDFFPPSEFLLISGGYLACVMILLLSGLALIFGKAQEALRLQVTGLIACQAITLLTGHLVYYLFYEEITVGASVTDNIYFWITVFAPLVVTLCLLATFMRRCSNWWTAAYFARLTVVVEIGILIWYWRLLFPFSTLILTCVVLIASLTAYMALCKNKFLPSQTHDLFANEFCPAGAESSIYPKQYTSELMMFLERARFWISPTKAISVAVGFCITGLLLSVVLQTEPAEPARPVARPTVDTNTQANAQAIANKRLADQRAAVRSAMYAFDASSSEAVRSTKPKATAQAQLQIITRHLRNLITIDTSQTPADFKTAFDRHKHSVERTQRVLAKYVSLVGTENNILRTLGSLERLSRGDNSGGFEFWSEQIALREQVSTYRREVENERLKVKAIAKRYGYTGQ